MASIKLDSTITPGNGAATNRKLAGATIVAGHILYKNTSNRLDLAQGDDAATDEIEGVALNGGVAGQEIHYAEDGLVEGLTGIVIGEIYCLAEDQAGYLQPIGDNGSGDLISVFGVGITATSLRIGILNSGVARA